MRKNRVALAAAAALLLPAAQAFDIKTDDPDVKIRLDLTPKFSAAYVESAKEQTLKTFVDILVTRKGDYRDVFTTRETYINRLLASVYQVPYISTAAWTRYTVPADHDSAGVITQATFLALFSHPGRTSPTKRGVALNEIFLCSPTPTPRSTAATCPGWSPPSVPSSPSCPRRSGRAAASPSAPTATTSARVRGSSTSSRC